MVWYLWYDLSDSEDMVSVTLVLGTVSALHIVMFVVVSPKLLDERAVRWLPLQAQLMYMPQAKFCYKFYPKSTRACHCYHHHIHVTWSKVRCGLLSLLLVGPGQSLVGSDPEAR